MQSFIAGGYAVPPRFAAQSWAYLLPGDGPVVFEEQSEVHRSSLDVGRG